MPPVVNLLGKKRHCWSVMVTNLHSFSNIYLSCTLLMIGKRTIVPWIGWITLFVIRDVFQFQGTMPLEIDRLQRSVTSAAIAMAVLLSIIRPSCHPGRWLWW